MSNIQIPNLPAAIALNGTEQLEGVQAGTSVRLTIAQIGTYITAQYPAPGVSSIATSAPITGGTISTTGTIGLAAAGVTNTYLASMTAGTVKANVTGSPAGPTDATPSAVLDLIGSTRGSLLYRNATQWLALAPSTAGYLLSTNGAGADPSWVSTTSVLPDQTGNNGKYLTTNGTVTSWAFPTVAASSVAVGTTTVSGGISGNILYNNAGTLGELATTGSGNVVRATSPTITGANLGTPTAINLSNATALPLGAITGLGTGVATALANNVGSAGAPVVNGGALGTPSSGTLTSATGLPISTGVSGLGTNVATALAVNVGVAGAFVVLGGALGTPSSGTLTNATGLPISTGVSGLGTGVATALGVNVGKIGRAHV
mgnify:FL=1